MPIAKIMSDNPLLPNEIVIGNSPDHIGGEAYLYFSGRFVVKIYKKGNQRGTLERLQKIIYLGKNLTPDQEQVLAWPLGIVTHVDGQPKLGCISRRVSNPPHVPLIDILYNSNEAVKQFRAGKSWMAFLKIARCTADAIRVVHHKGIVPCDISFNNVLADSHTGTAILIDLDSAIVTGQSPPPVGGTPRFQATELVMRQAEPSEQSDRHSAAILLLWALLFRDVLAPAPTACYSVDQDEDDRLAYGRHAVFSEHPTIKRHWLSGIGQPLYNKGALSYKCLTPKLQQLTEHALINGLHDASKRPQVYEWADALADAYDALIVCASCNQSLIYPYWIQPFAARRCPFCGQNPARVPLSILQLYDPGSVRGTATPTRFIVGSQGAPLFADLVEPFTRAPFSRAGTKIAGYFLWDEQRKGHRLLNKSDTVWQLKAPTTGQILKGQSIALQRGVTISFGNSKRSVAVME